MPKMGLVLQGGGALGAYDMALSRDLSNSAGSQSLSPEYRSERPPQPQLQALTMATFARA
jgi:hypothetical protein